VRTDLRKAGPEVITDGTITTSRSPDLPAFCARTIQEFAKSPQGE
jgi:protease I